MKFKAFPWSPGVAWDSEADPWALVPVLRSNLGADSVVLAGVLPVSTVPGAEGGIAAVHTDEAGVGRGERRALFPPP